MRPHINSQFTARADVTVARGRWEEDVLDIAVDDDKSCLQNAANTQLITPLYTSQSPSRPSPAFPDLPLALCHLFAHNVSVSAGAPVRYR